MATSKSRRWVAYLAALVLIALGMTLALETYDPQLAQAQSSVRPPANAVTGGNPEGGTVPGGSMGNLSDSEMWRAVRKGISGNVSIPDKKAGQLVQSEGDAWRAIRNGPLLQWGGIAIGAVLVILALFYLIRGRINVEHGLSGRTILRFDTFERMGHWLLAVSFIILAITGLNITFGRTVLLPVIGKDAFAAIALAGKWLHNYVAFAFMAGLVFIFLRWVLENIPNRHDVIWLLKGGGMFAKGVHPPAKKFNAGQKIIFWLVVIGGLSISMSGIALLFPFETAMFGKTFAFFNLFGAGLNENLTPLQEMQYATLWHAVVALFLIVVIIAHIYLGTIGMEGAFDAMGSGEVDENWAKEHHSIWAKEVAQSRNKSRGTAKTAPAE